MRLVLAAVSLTLLGCGGSGSQPKAPDDASVIRAWAADVRAGDMDAAASRFAVPAKVSNGTPELTLSTRAAIKAWNETLPCGATLLGTQRHHGVTIATFRLTDRTGGDCGSGAGGTASTAFEIVKGRITRWIRVPAAEDREENPVGEVV